MNLLLPLLGGMLFPFAFSPFEAPWVALPSLALLFFVWLNASPKQAFLRGYLFGVGQFGIGVSWIYISMHDYAAASVLAAGLLSVAFILFLALYPALAGWLSSRLFSHVSKRVRLVMVFPGLWILCEWFRGWFLTGFTWLETGGSQVDTVLGQGVAPIAGVYGAGLAVAVMAGTAVLAIAARGSARHAWLSILLIIPAVSYGLSKIEWTRAAGEPFSVALLQGNVSQDVKWQAESQRETLMLYRDLTRQNLDARLVIWPETAVPAFYHQVKDVFLNKLQQEAHARGSDVLIGIPYFDFSDKRNYNALISLGEQQGWYFKRHLVPFGEYVPLRRVLGFLLDILQIPMADFTQGSPRQSPLTAAGFLFAPSICYEDIFADDSRFGLPQAAYMVNVTNDAWFGRSIAPFQHVQMARLRALEAGRYLLRASNTGVTAIISERGSLLGVAPLFERTALKGSVQPMVGSTPYVRFGNLLVTLPLLIVLALLILRYKFRYLGRGTVMGNL
ncbi:apolipoprotein N-acyltransferase [Candidatus Methylospira mobilis]|nr:apolipoprotein N-acyltransferase [Candidatus Methylospira mobilis]